MELKSNSFLESNPKPSPTLSRNTYWGSNRLSSSEIASLRQDQKEASVYLQKVFPNPRMMAM